MYVRRLDADYSETHFFEMKAASILGITQYPVDRNFLVATDWNADAGHAVIRGDSEMIRPIAIRNYVHAMNDKGVPLGRILTDCGIDISKLDAPNYLVEPEQCKAIVKKMLLVTQDNGIGFDIGLNTNLTDLDIVGYAAVTSQGARAAYDLWNRFGYMLSGITGRFSIADESRNSVTLVFTGQDSDDKLLNFYVEEFLGMMIHTPMVGELPIAKAVALAYRAPPHAHRYREIFKCPIEFGAERSSITVSRRWFEKTLESFDTEFSHLCWDHCEEVLHRIDRQMTIISHLRRIFQTSIDSIPKLQETAGYLNMSTRTLRRRLLDAGTTYRAQVEAFRIEQARELLKCPELLPQEVGFRLGFSQASAFHHAFKSWTGQTIEEYRTQALLSMSEPYPLKD